MKQEMLDYIRSIKPAHHADGRELVKKGMEMGNSFEAGRSRFIKESNGKYSCWEDYKMECVGEGKIIWDILLGLATIDEECDAITELSRRATEQGFDLNMIQVIPSGNVGLPKEYRDKAPKTTSYMMEDFDDYMKQVNAAPVEINFCDHHLIVPNAIETTVNALKAGSSRVGEFSQFIWDYPGFDDEVKRYSDMVTALGIVASKRDEKFMVETYLDDGFPGYFMDCASYIGYALLEHYICEDLCNARYSISYGGLLSEIDTRLAIALALHRLLSTDEQLVMTYINGSTNIQWDHDINGNFGMSSQEMLFEILAERKFHMGLGINPVSVTEKIAVPTMDELWDIFCAGKRVEEKAPEWEPFMDWTKLENMAETMMREGQAMFENCLNGMKEAGIDIEDPLEMLLTLKHFDPVKFEQAFHSTTHGGDNNSVKPFFPTVLGRQTFDMVDEIIAEMKSDGFKEGDLNGKRVVLGSGDAHTYGLLLVQAVLTEFGCEVINAGVDMDAVDMLDMADEENSVNVAVSCHNGQALEYGRQMLQIAEERGKKYNIFMGGKLNSILQGHSEPTEIGGLLEDMGIDASNDIKKTVRKLKQQ